MSSLSSPSASSRPASGSLRPVVPAALPVSVPAGSRGPEGRWPVALVAASTPTARDTLLFRLLTDDPAELTGDDRPLVVVSYDMLRDGDGRRLVRSVVERTGATHRTPLGMDQLCLHCLADDDLVGLLALLEGSGRWSGAVVALPLTADPLPLAHRLDQQMTAGGRLARLVLAGTATALDGPGYESALLDDALLTDLDLELYDEDGRSLGEALASQVGYADLVLVGSATGMTGREADLLEHTRPHDTLAGPLDDPALRAEIWRCRHQVAAARARTDLRTPQPWGGPHDHGVWTLDLRSDRPFHPDRLLENIEELGCGRLRSWGHFWVPTRPDRLALWDGAGGQVSVGDLGAWDTLPDTRLVMVGVGDEADRIRAAFGHTLLTPAEWAAGVGCWQGVDDELAPWLGAYGPQG